MIARCLWLALLAALALTGCDNKVKVKIKVAVEDAGARPAKTATTAVPR